MPISSLQVILLLTTWAIIPPVSAKLWKDKEIVGHDVSRGMMLDDHSEVRCFRFVFSFCTRHLGLNICSDEYNYHNSLPARLTEGIGHWDQREFIKGGDKCFSIFFFLQKEIWDALHVGCVFHYCGNFGGKSSLSSLPYLFQLIHFCRRLV